LTALFLAAVLGVSCQRQEPIAAAPPASADEGDVRDLLTHYFATWSAGDIAAYGDCFSPQAQIWYAGYPSLPLNSFLESQRHAQSASPVPMTEVPLDMSVTVHNGLAHAQVHWELHQGGKNVRGYDFFTLMQANDRWQIVALVFNEEGQ
jgi:ketosteroid isomerase-like protein